MKKKLPFFFLIILVNPENPQIIALFYIHSHTYLYTNILFYRRYTRRRKKKSFDPLHPVYCSANHSQVNTSIKYTNIHTSTHINLLNLHIHPFIHVRQEDRRWKRKKWNEMGMNEKEMVSYQYKDKVEGFSIRCRFFLSNFKIAWTVIGGGGIAFSRI